MWFWTSVMILPRLRDFWGWTFLVFGLFMVDMCVYICILYKNKLAYLSYTLLSGVPSLYILFINPIRESVTGSVWVTTELSAVTKHNNFICKEHSNKVLHIKQYEILKVEHEAATERKIPSPCFKRDSSF